MSSVPAGPSEPYIAAKIVISSDARVLSTIRAAVGALTLELGFDGSESRAITLAVDEALTNKIRHAYGSRNDGRILVEFSIESNALVFRLTDQGEPPELDKLYARERESTAPGGFGTHIMRDVMDKVVYQKSEEGNQVVLTKYLPAGNKTPESSQ